MKRDLEKHLRDWVTHPLRKPLILRGARQVGKSWLARELGKIFESYIEINFEKEPSLKLLFQGDINLNHITEKISIIKKQTIIPGKTLLFLDEIQECEDAFKYLRYFKEELPELHVIAAGSLLDFTIEKIGMPVGRVEFLSVHPLSFGEYLNALGEDGLREQIQTQDVHEIFHQPLLEHIRYYYWLGGMPSVISAWKEHRNPEYCLEIQDQIIQAYRYDFEKYAKRNQIEFIEKVFSAIPLLIGRKFKYTDIDSEVRSTTLKTALFKLQSAGIAHIVYHSSGQGQPLAAAHDEKKFKVFLFDIGLTQRLLGLELSDWLLKPLEIHYIGAIAKQFVAQEIIAYSSRKTAESLYYWHRESRNSNAEVDFLTIQKGYVIPVEVKSGSTGSLKSLHTFLESHPNSPYAIKISEQRYHQSDRIISIPFYCIERLFL